MKKILEQVLAVISAIFGAVIFLIGLGMASQSFSVGIIFMVIGLIFIPQFNDFLANRINLKLTVKIKIVLFIIGFIAASLLASNQTPEPSNNISSTGSTFQNDLANPVEGTSNEQEPKVTSISTADFTLSNVKIKPYEGDTRQADVAGKLWVVYADIKNNSKETKVPQHSVSIEVKDSEGNTYKTADFMLTFNQSLNESFDGQKVVKFTDGILPGSTRKNVQVGIFDVSEGAKELQLCAGGLFSATKCISGS